MGATVGKSRLTWDDLLAFGRPRVLVRRPRGRRGGRHRLRDGRYGEPLRHGPGDAVRPPHLPGLEVVVDDALGPPTVRG